MARPGRRPLDPHDRSIGVTLRLPSKQYDALAQLAVQHRVSLAALTRFAVRRLLKAAEMPRKDEQP